MLVITDDPLAGKQRGDGFKVGQKVFLADKTNTVRASAEVATYDDGIATLDNFEVYAPEEVFQTTGTHILAISVPDPSAATRKVRQQQQAFRQAVLKRCKYTCVLSGCNVPEALEAAHLPGRSWETGHNAPEDGIALRADLHRLLDAGLIRIDPNGTVRTDLTHYEWLNGKSVMAGTSS